MKINQSSGFTLIEIMIVVAIVAILAAVAVGYYGDQVIASKRTDGRAALTSTATSLEKCRALYSDYGSANCNVAFPVTSDEGNYTITAPTLTAVTFSLTGTPVGRQSADTECTTMTLTNTGIKSGTGGDPTECW